MYTLIPFLKSVIKSLTHFCKMLHTSFRKTRIAVKRFNKKRKEGKKQTLVYEEKKHICKNCKAEFSGKYCFNCGQTANTKGLSWNSVIENIFGGITNIARGFGFTIIELFTRPGYMIHDFIKGKRVIYTKPFQMIFVLAAIYALFFQLLYPNEKENKKSKSEIAVKQKGKSPDSTAFVEIGNTIVLEEKNQDSANINQYAKEEKSKTKKTDNQIKEEEKDDKIDKRINELEKHLNTYIQNHPILKSLYDMLYDWVSTNKAISNILILPFMALAIKWAFYKKKRKRKYNQSNFNFVEILFACCYINCQMLIISIILLPFMSNGLKITMIELITTTWILKELFGNSLWTTFRKLILSYIYAIGMLVLLSLFIILIISIFLLM